MENSTQSAIFQTGTEIAYQNAGPGMKRLIYGYNSRLMLVKIMFETGAIGALHHHSHVQASYVENGVFELTIGDEKKILKQHDGYFVPSNIVHGLLCIEAGTLVEAFTPCREDMLITATS
ncbi:cupin domain-containing protein [Mucilaginibacter sp.]|uniref:cupin domain-containing protein n=1 Tax=Mucilaginibacter sp. TaxID=1882438 RepID=UPI002604E490|nr:cupin domain-containing protein [Mucilaginibacter sp.]MDB4924130.1 cupin [Mucilaginibacter sp.]